MNAATSWRLTLANTPPRSISRFQKGTFSPDAVVAADFLPAAFAPLVSISR